MMQKEVDLTRPQACPCQSGLAYALCCGPFHAGQANAPTPETLMRSRYSAFVLGHMDYLQKTVHGAAAKQFNAADCQRFASSVTWLGLTVFSTQTLSAVRGLVEFRAQFLTAAGAEEAIHERSVFQKIADRWYYVGQVKALHLHK